MAQDDAVTKALNAAHDTLAKANRFTESVTGNSTNAFAPEKPKLPPKGPKVVVDHTQTPYSVAHDARKAAPSTEIEGINEKMRNINEYNAANK
jgi:hypothetical protein